MQAVQQCISPRIVTSKLKSSLMLSISPCRSYATRGKPSKKLPSKVTAESANAPTEKEIKPKPKRVSKSASKDALDSTNPVTVSRKKTTIEVGTSFELRSLQLLHDNFSMALDRVAGPGDGGVDLVGWWWLPRLPSLSELESSATQDGIVMSGSSPASSRIRVLAQCKAEKIKMGPNYVREMEGVLHRVLNSPSGSFSTELGLGDGVNAPESKPFLQPIPTVAMLISQSRFTNGAVMRAMSSPIPFILLHLPPDSPAAKAVEEGEEVGEAGEECNPSLQWNAALGSERGLLGGHLEVRWQRETGGSYPRLWWQGQPISSLVP